MLRDNLVELIEPMLNSAGADPLALYIHTRTPASDDRLPCLKNPRPAGAESSLTESASSPFQAEPAHSYQSFLNAQIDPKYRSYTHRAPPLEPQAGIPSKITRHYSNNVFVNLTVQLDGASWDGDIFKDSIIQYNGGPVALRNVKFVNCQFKIPHQSQHKSLERKS